MKDSRTITVKLTDDGIVLDEELSILKQMRSILMVTKHLVCVKDGIIHDTYNSSIKQYYDDCGNLVTNDRRAVYGYWTAPQQRS